MVRVVEICIGRWFIVKATLGCIASLVLLLVLLAVLGFSLSLSIDFGRGVEVLCIGCCGVRYVVAMRFPVLSTVIVVGTVVVAVFHELIHVLVMRVLGVGFRVKLIPIGIALIPTAGVHLRHYVFSALAPQVITVVFYVFAVLGVYSGLAMFFLVLHLAMSSGDFFGLLYSVAHVVRFRSFDLVFRYVTQGATR